MSALVGAREHWWTDHTNLAALLRWLFDNDLIEENVSDIAYFVSKPWKWDDEWKQMIGELPIARAETSVFLVENDR